jgi:hypothetical protein
MPWAKSGTSTQVAQSAHWRRWILLQDESQPINPILKLAAVLDKDHDAIPADSALAAATVPVNDPSAP